MGKEPTEKRAVAFGLDDDNDFNIDLEGLSTKSNSQAVSREVVELAAEEAGFTSRQPTTAAPIKKAKPTIPIKQVDKITRRTAKRNTESTTVLGVRCKVSKSNDFTVLCDEQGWTSGDLLEYMLEAINEKIKDPSSEFWKDKKKPR